MAKRIFKGLLTIIVLTLGLILTIKISNTIQNFSTNKTVEHYCSVAHKNNVEDYKACKALTMTQLVESLTEQEQKANEIPELPIKELKF